MDGWKRARELLWPELNRVLDRFPADEVEEIRLRAGYGAAALINSGEVTLTEEIVTEEHLLRVLEKATGASLHAAAAALTEGYLNYRGLRIGICGRLAPRADKRGGFCRYSSLAIRIPRQCRGICDRAAAELAADWKNTLILAPPGGGKTTALRELIRCLSEKGKRIAVADDRNELSASDDGGMQFDLGPHSDVLVGAAKTEGCLMLLRAMNPEILAVDEITKPEDAAVLEQIRGCGVGILASAHGSGITDLRSRRMYREILDSALFQKVLLISGSGSQRRYQLLSLCP